MFKQYKFDIKDWHHSTSGTPEFTRHEMMSYLSVEHKGMNCLSRTTYSPTKYRVPPTKLVRIRVRVRDLESSVRNKRFSGRINGAHCLSPTSA